MAKTKQKTGIIPRFGTTSTAVLRRLLHAGVRTISRRRRLKVYAELIRRKREGVRR